MLDNSSNEVYFVSVEVNWNVMGLVNAANGNISAKYEYGPFGEVFCSVGDMAKVNPFGFSTKYTDNETDLVYYGYRYYSPALGRWLSRDPIEEQGGLNLYAFVNNDPVNKWDVLGLSLMDQGKRFVKGVGKRIFGDGKLCVHKNCEGVDLSRLTYVPENISKNTPAGERLKSLPSPGNCVAADALYFPGGA